MEHEMIKQQATKFKNARINLLLVIAFTAINLMFMIIETDLYFLFSATMPLFFYGLFGVPGLIIALVGIGLYLMCFILSKNMRVFILVALVIFGVDTLMFLTIAFGVGFEISFVIDLAFHAWVLVCLVSGTIAWAKLKNVNPEYMENVFKEIDVKKGKANTVQQYPNQQFPNQQFPNQQFPNQQFPNQQFPNQQYPNQQFSTQQNPIPQQPSQQIQQNPVQQNPVPQNSLEQNQNQPPQ